MRPQGFEAYWDGVDSELARYPAAPELERLARHSADFATVYGVRLTSIGPYRIFGYFSVPTGDGPFPALLQLPGYGSVVTPPHPDDRARYVILALMHRGQRHADQPFAAAYPGLLTHGIDDPATYIYRGIVADCLRGAEFLLSRPEVDTNRVAVLGNELAVITAARRPRFQALVPTVGSHFYRLMEARARTSAYPIEEVNDYLLTFPERADAVGQTLAHFDPLHHADRVAATTLLSYGSNGSLTGSAWIQPLRDALAGPVEGYRMTNEGGTDRDWIDAWLAGRLGVEPRPRVWAIA
jgi:cephalosporin-C deacetylase